MKDKKKIAIAVAILLAITAIALKIADSLKNAHLNVLVTPLDAKIIINGKEFKNGSYRFYPGTASIEINREGLETKKLEIELLGNQTVSLHEYLTKTDDNFEIYEESILNYEALKLVAKDAKAQSFIEKTQQKLAIQDILPLSRYSSSDIPSPINGQLGRETIINVATENPECNHLICLQLVDNTGNRNTAKQLLQEYGYNLDDYEVIEAKYE